LNYRKYIEDGELTAKEILTSVKDYIPDAPLILDWGCGPSRITRHLQKNAQEANIYACDPNIETILWNQKNIPNIRFEVQEKYPPLPFQDTYFDLVIGFSVLTHIPNQDQRKWLHEIHRILKPNGVAWLTTHGHYFIKQLSQKEKQEIETTGVYNTHYHQPGHRMMSTYHLPEKWKIVLEEKFEILEYWDGETYPNKAGKQDLWILRKRKV
jgi:ubiquinone/menaquinone biosynthesis C-methylase UbiE